MSFSRSFPNPPYRMAWDSCHWYHTYIHKYIHNIYTLTQTQNQTEWHKLHNSLTDKYTIVLKRLIRTISYNSTINANSSLGLAKKKFYIFSILSIFLLAIGILSLNDDFKSRVKGMSMIFKYRNHCFYHEMRI